MAIIVMSDGKQKRVTYGQAATVRMILDGEKEPADQKQADFVAQVAEVRFDTMRTKRATSRYFGTREHDTEMDAIIADKSLVGVDKAKAVVQRLRDRRAK